MSRTARAHAARHAAEDRLASLRTRQLAIAERLADQEVKETSMSTLGTRPSDPAQDPRTVTVATIMQMAHAFPGMAPDVASRLLHDADRAEREGPSAADTLGVFLAEARNPITGALEAGVRYRVHKLVRWPRTFTGSADVPR